MNLLIEKLDLLAIRAYLVRVSPNIIPILLGVIVYLLVVGPKALPLDSTTWIMLDEDGAQHYTGWLYFLNSPWSFPLGANPDFGIEIGSSIFYSDAIPLFSFIFKLLSPLMPENFQYFGLWILFCFVLHSWFSWKLVGEITDDIFLKLCATGLFTFSPPMLFRLYGHDSLAGHWIILSALYLCIAKDIRHLPYKWIAIVVVSSLVHPYLFSMTILLWIGNTVQRLLCNESSFYKIIFEYSIVVTGTFISLWQAGFFMVRSPNYEGGYGFFRMNINSLFNPSPGQAEAPSWSYVLPNLSVKGGDYEGFNYLGLGVIILFIFVLPHLFRHLRDISIESRWFPLIFISLVLTFFAISNNIGIGSFDIHIPIDDTIIGFASVLRSGGRMFWPVFYLILWCLIYFLVNNYNFRSALAIIALALTIQAVDTSAGWATSRKQVASKAATWEPRLKSPDWEAITSPYSKIRLIPPGPSIRDHTDIAYFAATNKMPTDAAYLARIDHYRKIKAFEHAEYKLKTGNYEIDSLYIISPKYVHIAKQFMNHERDLFVIIDGFFVLAPYWYQHANISYIENR